MLDKEDTPFMILIALEGMQFRARHGYYEEEYQLGNDYIIDVWLEALLYEENNDDIQHTVNYETVYLLCREEMLKPSKLIETVARRILKRLTEYFKEYQEEHNEMEDILGIKVRLRKMHPPLDGYVHSAWVEVANGSFIDPSLRKPKKKKKEK